MPLGELANTAVSLRLEPFMLSPEQKAMMGPSKPKQYQQG